MATTTTTPTTTTPTTTDAKPVTFSPNAISKVKEIMAQQNPVPAGLRVGVVGGGCSGFSYSMSFENGAGMMDKTFDFDGLKVFEMTPSAGGWNYLQLQTFSGTSGPWGDLIMDGAGNLYGTTVQDGAFDNGSVFKLTFSDGNWVYTDLHDFNGQDGAYPHGSLALDASGNLYGITTAGGPHNLGIAWEITP